MTSLVRIDICISDEARVQVTSRAKSIWEVHVFGTEHLEEGWEIHEEYDYACMWTHFTGLVDNRTAQMTMALAQGQLEAYLELEKLETSYRHKSMRVYRD